MKAFIVRYRQGGPGGVRERMLIHAPSAAAALHAFAQHVGGRHEGIREVSIRTKATAGRGTRSAWARSNPQVPFKDLEVGQRFRWPYDPDAALCWKDSPSTYRILSYRKGQWPAERIMNHPYPISGGRWSQMLTVPLGKGQHLRRSKHQRVAQASRVDRMRALRELGKRRAARKNPSKEFLKSYRWHAAQSGGMAGFKAKWSMEYARVERRGRAQGYYLDWEYDIDASRDGEGPMWVALLKREDTGNETYGALGGVSFEKGYEPSGDRQGYERTVFAELLLEHFGGGSRRRRKR